MDLYSLGGRGRVVYGQRFSEVCDDGREPYEVMDHRLPDVVHREIEYGLFVLWGAPWTGPLL